MTSNPTLNAAETLAALDRRIADRSILNHPFYRAWQAGTLTREQLAGYAREYYPHVEAFPRYLEAALATTQDVTLRTELADNLREELSVPAPHPALWLDFAHGLGGDAEEIRSAQPTSATATTVARFEELCRKGPGAALSALYCYESQQPRVAAEKAKGLAERYGVSDPAALSYFTVHAEADIRHSEGERHAIAHCLETGATTSDEILAAADQALDAYWSLLDGICASNGVECELPVH
jgi:pyrroloquinoline-quinone synthase